MIARAAKESGLKHLRKFATTRRAVREAAINLSMGLSDAWPMAREAPTGPVDVIDMFAGCGGMSAGFVAANAILPAYRLALAVDIDSLAMQTYEAKSWSKNHALSTYTDFADDQREITKTGTRSEDLQKFAFGFDRLCSMPGVFHHIATMQGALTSETLSS